MRALQRFVIGASAVVVTVCSWGCGDQGPALGSPLSRPDAQPASDLAAVRSVIDDVGVPSSGRFQMETQVGTTSYGMEPIRIVVSGSFDRVSATSELVLDLAAMFETLPEGHGLVIPDELGDEMTVRTVGEATYLQASGPIGPWVQLEIPPREVARALGVQHPDDLLAVVGQTGHEVTAVPGDPHGGVPTVRLSGWLGREAFEHLAPGSGTSLGVLADLVAPSALDRMVRFALWVGGDGLPRRLVLELDVETLAAIADGIDGSGAVAATAVMRTVVEWFDLEMPVAIEIPPADQVRQVR